MKANNADMNAKLANILCTLSGLSSTHVEDLQTMTTNVKNKCSKCDTLKGNLTNESRVLVLITKQIMKQAKNLSKTRLKKYSLKSAIHTLLTGSIYL
jgi:hypothetical protein